MVEEESGEWHERDTQDQARYRRAQRGRLLPDATTYAWMRWLVGAPADLIVREFPAVRT